MKLYHFSNPSQFVTFVTRYPGKFTDAHLAKVEYTADCRQECLDEDWKSVHQFVCQNMRADPRRKIRKPLKDHMIAGVTVAENYEEVD